MTPILVWFRQDLRLADNPALYTAAQANRPLLLIYIDDDKTPGPWKKGKAQRWWLIQSLLSLKKDLATHYKIPLIIRKGVAEKVLLELVETTSAHAVYWNRCYEPYAKAQEHALTKILEQRGILVFSFNGNLLYEPGTLLTQQNKVFKVYTPFWQACRKTAEPRIPLPKPVSLIPYEEAIESHSFESESVLYTQSTWAKTLEQFWQPGEKAAHQRLKTFITQSLPSYMVLRNMPFMDGTSRLSPHLHFGEISPQQIWHKVQKTFSPDLRPHIECYLSELGWREFFYHLLDHFPHLPEKNFKPEFDNFSWNTDLSSLQLWQQGKTGYPIVDAGMRQLLHTGWIHNRVRMVVASFLTKDLLIHWQEGQKWFWETLVDADLANNAANWQWVAGSGADAAPYFRIFNPTTQAEKFDPNGDYIRTWVPELAKLPQKYIHRPWSAPLEVLKKSAITLGTTYPWPLVDHSKARQYALNVYEKMRKII